MPINLTPHQQIAFDGLNKFLTSPHQSAVLSGPAGSGKTHLVAEFLKHNLNKRSICIVAPTNKALNVAREALAASGIDMFYVASSTIHRLLGLRVHEHENGNTSTFSASKEPAPITEYDLILIDESSLISHDLYKKMLSRCRSVKLIWVGDRYQLSPVKCPRGISPVFTDIPVNFRLTEVVRQAAGNPIIALTSAIVKAFDKGRVSINTLLSSLPVTPSKVICKPGSLSDIVNATAMLQSKGRDARAIAYTNAQVCAINQRVHETLYPNTMFGIGERVLNYSGGKTCLKYAGALSSVFSMDEFTVVSCASAGRDTALGLDLAYLTLKFVKGGGQVEVEVPVDNAAYMLLIKQAWKQYNILEQQHNAITRHTYEKEKLRVAMSVLSSANFRLQEKYPDLRFAYAMTAHTAQGSTFDDVIIDYKNLLGMNNPREFNSALYVGCSRPRDRLAIFY